MFVADTYSAFASRAYGFYGEAYNGLRFSDDGFLVYGSGYVPLARMIRYGILLDIVGVFVIVALVRLLVPFLR